MELLRLGVARLSHRGRVGTRRGRLLMVAATLPAAAAWLYLAAATAPSASAATAKAPTVTSLSPVSGPVGGASQPPISRQSAAFPLDSESAGNSSLTVSPVKVGDLVVLSVQLHSASVAVTSVTGGNTGAWKRAIAYTNTTTDTLHYEVWWGVATATGPSTLHLTYSTAVAQLPIELVADSFTTASPLPWSVVTSGGSSNPTSGTASWPALTSSKVADQLYWGVSEEESAGTSTSTGGFTSNDTAYANCFLFDGGLSPSTTYAPTCGETPAAVSTAVGVIFAAGTSTASGTPGTAVTITGTNFAAGDTVSFGSSPATSVNVLSSTSIAAVAPPGDPSRVGGTVDVTVTGPGGTSAITPADEYTYEVSSSTYAIALAATTTTPAAGAAVTLTATANVDVGPTPYGMSIVNASTGVILAHAGSGSSFSTTVTQSAPTTQRFVAEVDNAGGANIQANSQPVIVTWSGTAPPVPTVTKLSPTSGPATGGTTVTVTGTGFASGDTVDFGSTPATSVAVASSTSLTAVSPAGTGTVDVTVSGPGGTSGTTSADRFTYSAPSTGGSTGGGSTGGNQTYAEASGFPVYARGGGLASISLTPKAVGDLVVLFVELHSVSAPIVTGLSSSNVAWQTAASAVDTDPTVPLHIEIWEGVATSTSAAATTITYSGSVSSNSIELIADSFHYSGSGTWTLVKGGGTNGSSTKVAFPSLTSASGSAGGTGGGVYVGYSRVASSYAGGVTSGFSAYGTPMGNVELRNVAMAPSTTYAPTALQSVSGEYSSIGAIFADAGTSAPPAPTVTGLSPTSGAAAGGTKVTVTGTGFAAGDTVAFGSTPATSVTVASATSLTAVSPAGTGTVDVTVSGAGGSSATTAADRFAYVATPPPAPTVTGLSPTSGAAAGGTKVTVTGTGFAAGDTVAFGSTPATSVTVASATSLTAVSPAGTGTVDVTVSGAGGSSGTTAADRFTYVAPITGPAPTYAEASGFPVYSQAGGLTSISLTPQTVGDLVVLVVELHSGASLTVTGLSSSNIAWQPAASAVDNDASVPLHLELWEGVATSTATATTTITYSGSVSSQAIEVIADSFHYGASGTWSLVTGGGANGSSSTVVFPSLTSAAGSAGGTAGGIYVGYSRVASSYSGTVSTGFTGYLTPLGNVEIRGVTLSPATVYAPTASQSVSGEYSAIGAIFAVH